MDYPMIYEGLRFTFESPFEQYKHRIGQSAVVVEETFDHDDEVGPMYRIRFDDGEEIDAWPEEITGEWT